MTSSATVSVVLVNYKGFDDTVVAIESLYAQDWPQQQLEIVVVDNASDDGSADRLTSRFPHVKIIASERNLGFAAGCNLGVINSSGQYVAFLNNDARAHPNWLTRAIEAFELDATLGCVASKVLTWDGAETDFVDAGMTFYGQAFKPHNGQRDDGRWDQPSDVLFASGAAMVMPRRVFQDLRGFDERYFMFYEDVDLGWRTWLAGYRVRLIPTSIVYHRHHNSMQHLADWYEFFLLERNGLFTLYKNLSDDSLSQILPAALLLSTRRGTERALLDPGTMDLSKGANLQPADHERLVSRSGLASLMAQDDFLSNLASLDEDRRWIQSQRRCSESTILALFRQPRAAVMGTTRFLQAMHDLEAVFRIDDLLTAHRVLVVTNDALGARMAGPAIRALEMAETLVARARSRVGVLDSSRP